MKRVAFCLLLLAAAPVLGKSYRYPSVRTQVWLERNGDARIIQERTYRFEGSFSWAFVDLRKRGSEGIRLNGISELQPTGGWLRLQPLEVNDGPSSLYVKWGYLASDEERTFMLDYTVLGAVKRYQDVAEFYWKVIEDEHEPMDETELEVVLPGASPGLFKVYVHSRAAPGTLDFAPRMDRVNVRQSGIPRNAFVEARVLARSELFPKAPTIARDAYGRILREEQGNYIRSAVKTYLAIPLGIILILAVPVLLLILLYLKHGREPALDYSAVYEHEPPRKAPPFVVPAITAQQPQTGTQHALAFRGMFATLLDLARKGLVRVEQEKKGLSTHYRFRRIGTPGEPAPDDFSNEVAGFMFDRVAGGRDSFTDDDFKAWGRDHAGEVRALLSGHYENAKAWWERELGGELLDPIATKAWRISNAGSLLSVVAGVLVTGYGLGQFFGGQGPLQWVLPAVLGVLVYIALAAFARGVLRWSPAAHLEHRRWMTFRKFLVEFSAIEEAPVGLLAIWEQYYVYAAALGVAKDFLKNVGRLALRQGTELATPSWFAGAAFASHGAGSFQEGMAGLVSFGDNFSSMAASFSPKSSSGGGFSGGGGGGGGGGSSGAG